MRSICLALLFIGCTQAAMQQIRSPVYSSPKAGGVTVTNKQPEPPAVAPITTQQGQVQAAQAREGTGPVPDATGVSTAPNAQNYLIYYYPEQGYRAGQTTPASGVQYSNSEPSLLSRIPWTDVGYVVLSLAFIGVGSAVLYNGVGTQVKARAMRELEGMDFEDASQMARRVLRAIEKFQTMTVENQ